MRSDNSLRLCLLASLASGAACGGSRSTTPAAGSGDASFTRLASNILDYQYRRQPTLATDLGIHAYDDQLEDYSREAVTTEVDALQTFRAQLQAIDVATLTLPNQLDREQVIHALDSRILTLGVVKAWARDPDLYSSGITRSADVMIKRSFAPPADRLKHLVERERKMPAALAAARRNLDSPPRVYTEIAIEQLDGNHDFFEKDVPAAFQGVSDAALLTEFQQTNHAVIAALIDYKAFLQEALLPNSKGHFAIGGDTYAKMLAADEMVDLPIDRLLSIAEADQRKNEDAFIATAKRIDSKKSPGEVLASLQLDHPPAAQLLTTAQATLDSLRQFIIDHHLVTVPPSEAVRVKETPPFMRSTTTASMDIPGPFEHVGSEAYFYMTLPNPRWPAAQQADYMRKWYYAGISNTSVHEVYPGHYLQFLYQNQFPSVRKVYAAASNVEGWAHYCEQMILDEGFHADDPKYRLAQLQGALLRDLRFIVGIKMHTQDMTVEEATRLFQTQGHQPAAVSQAEAKRGTSNPTYGYYTMGKLMILKLRDDYKAKMGSAYTLQGFHDAFVALGPLPVPLIRREMLGTIGQIL